MPRLVIHLGNSTDQAPRTVDLIADAVVGRNLGCTIPVADMKVSKEHFRLERSGKSWVLRDLGSLNGTWVNHKRVERAALFDGDWIEFGSSRAVFQDPAGPRRPVGLEGLLEPAAGYEVHRSSPYLTAVQSADGLGDVQPEPDRAQLFFRIASALTEVGSTEELLSVVANRVSAGALVDVASVYLLRENEGLVLHGRWVRAHSKPLPEVSPNLLDHLREERTALLLHRQEHGEPKRTSLGLPLLRPQRLFGALWLESGRHWPLSTSELDFLVLVARQAALALDALS